MKVLDIGNKCVHCRQDTSFGSGRWVDRYPAEIVDEENFKYPNKYSKKLKLLIAAYVENVRLIDNIDIKI